ncbi:MAG: hypothetical protein A2Y41_13420 [Spirochaetes bacterium GWB1_36_13]|nr:MAG: hypothetical protein A2Y41_13420 [Spirochaetes bacterium GWB1_36_13]
MFETISIPIKLPIKKTNSTVIFDEPLSIIDPGVKSLNTLKMIDETLQKKGKSLKDIRRILLTHGHIDHFGAAMDIQKISGAEIFIHPHDFEKIQRKNRNDDEFTLRYKDILTQHGCPEKGLLGIDRFWDYIKDMYDPILEVSFYQDPFIKFATTKLEIIETPGHTRGSVVFFHPETGLLISGDTVIDGITPNPVIEFLENGNRFASQSCFRESIQKISSYPVKKIIGGHGKENGDPKSLFKSYQEEWSKNETKLISLFEKHDSLSAYEALVHIFGELEDFNIFLGMSEMIGSFDYLESKEKIIYFEKNGKVRAKMLGITK